MAMEIGEGGSGWMQRTEPRRGPTVPRTMRDLNQSSICKSATSESCPHTTQHHFRMPFFQHKTSQSRGSLGPHKPLSVDGGHPRFWSATLRLCAGVQKHHWLTAADRQDVPWLEWRGIGGSLWIPFDRLGSRYRGMNERSVRPSSDMADGCSRCVLRD